MLVISIGVNKLKKVHLCLSVYHLELSRFRKKIEYLKCRV